ncbi:beta-glucosidase-like glycosyl hydrolase [Catenuloplanes nepalensis]|uniref:Beta-glucosidase-like glycosyl hydrolase n=1 Tax=Catenuloplanes nepalensis TaxID=587533 RepID=A0ABT9MNR5_9ACTN|nr:beta-glucosidase-like glycosyl hydrolase [Catenuloplanes nepalensis]
MLKHFVGNEQELDRATSLSNIDSRTLHQVYNLPFEIADDIGQPAGVMCGYNQLNGTYSCENPALLTTYLRQEMGFDGFVVTDNGSQHSTAASLNAGLDQELSLPLYFTPANLHAALDAGDITEAQIRAAALRVVRAKFANGAFDHRASTIARSGRAGERDDRGGEGCDQLIGPVERGSCPDLPKSGRPLPRLRWRIR